MKKKLLLISVPILMSVLGLLIVQVSWIDNVFDKEYRSANTVAVVALRNSLEKFHAGQREAIAKKVDKKFLPLVDSVTTRFTGTLGDSLIIELENVKNYDPRMFRFRYRRGKIVVVFPSGIIFNKTPDKDYNAIEKIAKELIDGYQSTAKQAYSQADSIKIKKYIDQELTEMGRPKLNLIAHLNFIQGNNAVVRDNPKPNGTYYMEYYPSGLMNYFGERRFLAISFPGLTGQLAAKLVFLIMLSCFLTFCLIFSIVYLIKLILQQKQLAEMKDDFINNLTHEFKTPIATVSAAIEGLQKFNAINDKEKTERYLDISRTELNRLNDMVSKVLNISSYERKDLKLDKEKIDLEETVNEVTQMELVKGVKPVRFSVNISPDVKQLIADPLHIKNVLGNLIDNAVKYSKNEVDISITAYRDKSTVAIKIKDNGIGIAAKDLKFIFDKFYRVTDGNLYNTKGNGLGLNYVRSIVEAHGGTITAKSEINTGTEFIITLPLNNG